MRFRITELRRIIRNVILESEEERVYDDTVLPGEEADEDLLAEPDLTDQEERDEYIDTKRAAAVRKRKMRLRSRQEAESLGDEHAIVGAIGPLGAGNGSGDKPYSKKMKSRNAMSRPLDEYDE